MFFRRRSYDFDQNAADGLDLRRCSVVKLAGVLSRYGVETIEVNEPLMRGGLVMATCSVAAARIRDKLFRRRTRVVTYAIGNHNPFRTDPTPTIRSRLRRWLDLRAASWLWCRLDRVAFGTLAAQRTYLEAFASEPRDGFTLISALPARCECQASASGGGDPRKEPGSVVFVGALSERKGIRPLLESWRLVALRNPAARLAVLGTGDLSELVTSYAAEDSSIEVFLDPTRRMIHEKLSISSVAVLLSQPRPRWREQVGLPIVEALAHGCTVVTTSETGLAAWLHDHGHIVLAPESTPELIADTLLEVLTEPVPPSAVLADLPETDGREKADAWMFGSTSAAGRQSAQE